MQMESHSTSSTVSQAAATGRGLRIALWSAQVVLAIVFALAGGMKLTTSAADLAKMTPGFPLALDRKSTRLNSSHRCISYAVFCLKKKKIRKRLTIVYMYCM